MDVDGLPGSEVNIFDWGSVRFPDWSPTENRIVFDYRGWIYFINADGTEFGKLTLPDRPRFTRPADPHWSADGRFIVFTSGVFGERGSDLFIVKPDGSCFRRLTDDEYINKYPSWGG
jgi:Tol biopolymer transport system component